MTTATATDKQIAFIGRLAAERNLELELAGLDKRAASRMIDSLMSTSKAAKASATPVATDDELVGVHYLPGATGEGSVVRVVWNRARTRAYAKELRGTSWEYVGRSIFPQLSAGTKVTYEVAAAHGLHTGQCLICGIELENQESKQYGIGPVCFKNVTGQTFAAARKAGQLASVVKTSEAVDRELALV